MPNCSLPEDWAKDRDRCNAAGIPADMTYRPKTMIALEQLDRAQANGVPLDWLTFDEGYGKSPEFVRGLDERQAAASWARFPRSCPVWLSTTRGGDPTWR